MRNCKKHKKRRSLYRKGYTKKFVLKSLYGKVYNKKVYIKVYKDLLEWDIVYIFIIVYILWCHVNMITLSELHCVPYG